MHDVRVMRPSDRADCELGFPFNLPVHAEFPGASPSLGRQFQYLVKLRRREFCQRCLPTVSS